MPSGFEEGAKLSRRGCCCCCWGELVLLLGRRLVLFGRGKVNVACFQDGASFAERLLRDVRGGAALAACQLGWYPMAVILGTEVRLGFESVWRFWSSSSIG